MFLVSKGFGMNYKGRGRLLACSLLEMRLGDEPDLWLVMICLGNEFVVATYNEGQSSWNNGTYLPTYRTAINNFTARCVADARDDVQVG